MEDQYKYLMPNSMQSLQFKLSEPHIQNSLTLIPQQCIDSLTYTISIKQILSPKNSEQQNKIQVDNQTNNVNNFRKKSSSNYFDSFPLVNSINLSIHQEFSNFRNINPLYNQSNITEKINQECSNKSNNQIKSQLQINNLLFPSQPRPKNSNSRPFRRTIKLDKKNKLSPQQNITLQLPTNQIKQKQQPVPPKKSEFRKKAYSLIINKPPFKNRSIINNEVLQQTDQHCNQNNISQSFHQNNKNKQRYLNLLQDQNNNNVNKNLSLEHLLPKICLQQNDNGQSNNNASNRFRRLLTNANTYYRQQIKSTVANKNSYSIHSQNNEKLQKNNKHFRRQLVQQKKAVKSVQKHNPIQNQAQQMQIIGTQITLTDRLHPTINNINILKQKNNSSYIPPSISQTKYVELTNKQIIKLPKNNCQLNQLSNNKLIYHYKNGRRRYLNNKENYCN